MSIVMKRVEPSGPSKKLAIKMIENVHSLALSISRNEDRFSLQPGGQPRSTVEAAQLSGAQEGVANRFWTASDSTAPRACWP
jgi:hypothetical protein